MSWSEFQAGVGRAVITPPVGIAHAGWGNQRHRRAAGIDLDLWTTVLALATEEAEVIIVDLDLGVLTVEDADRIRKEVETATGVPRDNVRVSYTHTHAGPTTSRNTRVFAEGQELVGPWLETVVWQTVGAARAALRDLRPARVAAGVGHCDIAVNRRLLTAEGRTVVGQNPAGSSDDEVLVVRIDDEGEQPIACVVGYACHPITLAWQNELISPDFPGVTRRSVEALTGGMCLYLQGCAGDLMPVQAFTGDVGVHRRLGTMLGAEASKVFHGIRTRGVERRFDRIVESGAPLGVWVDDPLPDQHVHLGCVTRSITMPVREFPTPDDARLEAEEWSTKAETLREANATSEDVTAALAQAKRAAIRSNWAIWASGRTEMDVELQAIRLGPVGLVGFPGEPFAATGVAVREESPLPFTQLAGYSNGWRGYVPTVEDFPHGGYEVETASPYSDKAAEVLKDAAIALLGDLTPEGGPATSR